MTKRTKWRDISTVITNPAFKCLGVYRIRAVDDKCCPITVRRIAKDDSRGLLYIGRSGFWAETNQTVAKRLSEFLSKRHSGARSYWTALPTLLKAETYSIHHLQAQAFCMPSRAVASYEKRLLAQYFSKFGELPPYNSKKV